MSFFLLLNTNEDILKNDWNQLFGTIDFHSRKKNTMEVNGVKVPIVLPLCSAEDRNSYRFATT